MLKLAALRQLAVCLAACIAMTPAVAATINTIAKDASGKGVAGVVMTLQDANGVQAAQQTTDAQGNATFLDIAPGRCTVRSSKPTTASATRVVDVTNAAGVD